MTLSLVETISMILLIVSSSFDLKRGRVGFEFKNRKRTFILFLSCKFRSIQCIACLSCPSRVAHPPILQCSRLSSSFRTPTWPRSPLWSASGPRVRWTDRQSTCLTLPSSSRTSEWCPSATARCPSRIALDSPWVPPAWPSPIPFPLPTWRRQRRPVRRLGSSFRSWLVQRRLRPFLVRWLPVLISEWWYLRLRGWCQALAFACCSWLGRLLTDAPTWFVFPWEWRVGFPFARWRRRCAWSERGASSRCRLNRGYSRVPHPICECIPRVPSCRRSIAHRACRPVPVAGSPHCAAGCLTASKHPLTARCSSIVRQSCRLIFFQSQRCQSKMEVFIKKKKRKRMLNLLDFSKCVAALHLWKEYRLRNCNECQNKNDEFHFL